MAVKTFTAYSGLSASDTNTYLANSGLVYITDGTRSAADARIENCFSATYDSYRIVVTNYTTPGVRTSAFQFLSGSTVSGAGYNFGGWYSTWAGGAGAVVGSAQSYWQTCTPNTNPCSFVIDVHRPFLTSQKTYNVHAVNFDAMMVLSGNFTNSISYNGWRITNLNGDANTFSYVVYGYRKA